MIMKNISVHGWPSGHALDSVEAIVSFVCDTLLQSAFGINDYQNFAQHLDVKCMVEKFPLKDVEKAVEHMLSGKSRFRCVLTME